MFTSHTFLSLEQLIGCARCDDVRRIALDEVSKKLAKMCNACSVLHNRVKQIHFDNADTEKKCFCRYIYVTLVSRERLLRHTCVTLVANMLMFSMLKRC